MSDSRATDNDAERFDWILTSPVAIPPPAQWRFRSLAEMLNSADPHEDGRTVLLGADHAGPLEITLADLRRAARRARQWMRQVGLSAGESALLVRLPHSSEAPLAAAAVALMACGIRVVLPMSFDRADLADMAAATGSRAMLWCTGVATVAPNETIQGADAMYRAVAAELGVPVYSLDEQLNWHAKPETDEQPPREISTDENTDAPADREVLVLSTSGSSGRPKLVRYTESALLRVAEAWRAAGLMSPELTGGRSICPTVSHSMGFRNVLHAIWNRQPTLLAQPEWLDEQPKKFVKMLQNCRPEHITCGPALLRDLALLARTVQRVKDGLSSLRVIVSSGAADLAAEAGLPADVPTANAFGMTEVQQALNTLLGPAQRPRGALGRPLPGVAAAVRFVDAERKLGQLFIRSEFKARGYVGAPDFGTWFDTGDLVRVDGDDLTWVGRLSDDFINTGQGVKTSLAELNSVYRHLQQAAEAVLFCSLPACGGVAAIAYVGEQDPAAADVRDRLLEAIHTDHRRLAEARRDFALDYMAVTAVGCTAGRPPRRGPGKIDRDLALEQAGDLLAAMSDPAADHPHVLRAPRFGSDRPDWRRYASENS